MSPREVLNMLALVAALRRKVKFFQRVYHGQKTETEQLLTQAAAAIETVLAEYEQLRKERDEAIDDFHVSHGVTWQDEVERVSRMISDMTEIPGSQDTDNEEDPT